MNNNRDEIIQLSKKEKEKNLNCRPDGPEGDFIDFCGENDFSEITNFSNIKKSVSTELVLESKNEDKKYANPKLIAKIPDNYFMSLFQFLKLEKYSLHDLSDILDVSYHSLGNIIYHNGVITLNNFKLLKQFIESNFFTDKFSKGIIRDLFQEFYMNKKLSLKALEQIFEVEIIPHEIFVGKRATIKSKLIILVKNRKTAEFICIMLGDGSLYSDGGTVNIAFNGVDEQKYLDYVIKNFTGGGEMSLFKDVPFRKVLPRGFPQNKGVKLEINRQAIHYAITTAGRGEHKTGLIPGDKVKNQVCVPDWIYPDYEDISLVRCGLKGLFDTDGSIFVESANNLVLAFTSGSKPLAFDFYDMCCELDIIPSSKPKKYSRNEWNLKISDRKSIKKFISIVDPEKYKDSNRRYWLGLKLMIFALSLPLRNAVKMKIYQWKKANEKKLFHYSLYHISILKSLIESTLTQNNINSVYGLNFTNKITYEIVEKALSTAFLNFKALSINYNKNKKKYVIHYPKDIRNKIIDIIVNNKELDEAKNIIEIIKKYIIKSDYIGKIDPFGENNYLIEEYYELLIFVVKEIGINSSSHILRCCNEFSNELIFGMTIINSIRDYIFENINMK